MGLEKLMEKTLVREENSAEGALRIYGEKRLPESLARPCVTEWARGEPPGGREVFGSGSDHRRG